MTYSGTDIVCQRSSIILIFGNSCISKYLPSLRYMKELDIELSDMANWSDSLNMILNLPINDWYFSCKYEVIEDGSLGLIVISPTDPDRAFSTFLSTPRYNLVGTTELKLIAIW